MSIRLLFIPVLGAVIGWLSNYLTLKMLFHPAVPIHIPLINLTLWGELPRRQQELAEYIAERVERELLSSDQIIKEMKTRGIITNLTDSITTVVKNRVQMKIPAIVPNSLRGIIGNIVGEILKKEVPHFIEESAGKLVITLKEEMHVQNVIVDKVNSLNTRDMEKIATKELRLARMIGAIAGFLLGLLVLLIISL